MDTPLVHSDLPPIDPDLPLVHIASKHPPYPMESYIEKKLQNPEINSQEETKQFVSELQGKITLYEKSVYDRGDLDADTLNKIKRWRTRLLEIVRANKERPVQETPEEAEGIEVLKLLNRQLDHANVNQKILDNSTLKLASLDLSTDELDKVIVETRVKFEKSLKKEEVEYRRLVVAFMVFILVCIAILFDKFRSRLLYW